MPENTEEKTIDWQALYDYERHRIPVRELCPDVQRHFQWAASNQFHKIPIKWLEHYARAFHFTDEEIWAARTTSEAPTASGVYFLFDGDECVYIGETQNFSQRMVQHMRNGMPRTSCTYFEAPKFHTPSIEAYYIRRINPVLNNLYPSLRSYSNIVERLGLDRA
jgi:hypothetical protein